MAKQPSASEGKVKQEAQQNARRNEPAQGLMEREAPRRPSSSSSSLNEVEFNARVARKAFELFERRGGDSGHDVEDWLEAERVVKEEIRREHQS